MRRDIEDLPIQGQEQPDDPLGLLGQTAVLNARIARTALLLLGLLNTDLICNAENLIKML
jgi:hypothetical protein